MSGAPSPVAPTVAVIIVTYNSGEVLAACLDALAQQTRQPETVLIVDNNSPDPAYLNAVPQSDRLRLIRNVRNDGFCGGNNLGYQQVRDHKYILLLNPDAFPKPDFIERAVQWMEQPEHSRASVLTGTLLSFDTNLFQPTGLIDSTGIFQKWFGQWHDRGRGERWTKEAEAAPAERIPAACGALMFCRRDALEEVVFNSGEIFDPRFFMYKEDIDLSLRLWARGWEVVYWPSLLCYHGRGWQNRSSMSARAKYLSARNELRMCLRIRHRGVPFSLPKFCAIAVIYGFSLLGARLKQI